MSITETAEPETYTDMELFLLEDFEFEVPCDGRPHREDCSNAVKWEALLSCGCTRLWCDEHLKYAQHLIETIGMSCLTCHEATGVWREVTILFLQSKSPGH